MPPMLPAAMATSAAQSAITIAQIANTQNLKMKKEKLTQKIIQVVSTFQKRNVQNVEL